jgi:hypothetical protein
VAALAAAVAVIAIAVAATVAGSSGGSRPGALSVLGAPTPPAPRYLVGTVQLGHARGLGIFNARTGKRTGVVRPPGRGMSFLTVAATAPGRFIAAAVHSSPHSCSSARLYRLTLTSRGKLGRLAPLPGGRVNGTLTSLGASAGGRVIAYAADHCNGRPGWLGVIRPATGQSRRWPLRSGGLLNLTLTPDGRTVYFLNTPVLEGDGSIRAMSTSAPAGPMTRRARIVLGAGSASASDGSIALAGHGRILLACQEIRQTAVLTAYRAATGGELAVLHTWPHVDVSPCTLTAAASGGYLLISDIGTHLWRMQLGSGGTRQLPIATDAVDQVAW